MFLSNYGIDHTRLPLSLPTGNKSHLWKAVVKCGMKLCSELAGRLVMVDESGSGRTAGLLNPSR